MNVLAQISGRRPWPPPMSTCCRPCSLRGPRRRRPPGGPTGPTSPLPRLVPGQGPGRAARRARDDRRLSRSRDGRGIKAATIGRRVAAIRHAHKLAGHEPPTNSEVVKATVRGIRRTIGAAKTPRPPRGRGGACDGPAAPAGLKGLRDRALLLLGFAGAFRRSELVALDVADVEEDRGRRPRDDPPSEDRPGGRGVTIAVVRGGGSHLPGAGAAGMAGGGRITEGAMFRPVAKGGRVRSTRLSDKAVASVVKAYARRLGLDAADFSGHSLRSGFLTSAARRGASVFKMRDVSRHKSMDVLQGYVRDAELFRDHAGAGLL